ncbi:L,D-transpeptidase catalytic domain [Meinhardsimonia xiamenensis]|uniref:L,D-transpeptidase catalytic domain n=1 Tax=Meinhardsimonia xiamenensis TaxID=990712 RepID=A0A1G8YF34_9RHOB|nr:L,D-transpeptidase [Meinhardsimonia xiamenensis]PRX37275.1 L,D-transpeptidase-like protein [Meinhardsimonia xiamenensis]SDK01283.1 L,D-transpeptidase catalytic domain [Meinhardsimonia xiamenensis]
MISRRGFLTGACAMTVASPSVLRAGEHAIAPRFRPRLVPLRGDYEVGRILVTPHTHFLYHVVAPGEAMRYGVGVGREGLTFRGEAVVGAKRKWPSWRPTDEMLARNPREYARFIEDPDYIMPGGPDNPLGARALYLYQNGRDTYYRIHGTNAPQTIGRSVSNGCIRMLNEHVIELYDKVPIGTPVTVF